MEKQGRIVATVKSWPTDNTPQATIDDIHDPQEKTTVKFCQGSCLQQEMVAKVVSNVAIVNEDGRRRNEKETMSMNGAPVGSLVADIILR